MSVSSLKIPKTISYHCLRINISHSTNLHILHIIRLTHFLLTTNYYFALRMPDSSRQDIGQQAAKKITLRSQKSNSDIIPKTVSVGNVKIVSSVQPQNQKSTNPRKLDEAKFNKSGSRNTDGGSSFLDSAKNTTENATESTKNVASNVTDSAKNSAKDTTDSAKNSAKNATEYAKNTSKDTTESTKNVASDVTDSAKNSAKNA
ncbi:hypothetical protein GcM1_107003, partial [Golovinomyces cichoracearum]